MEHGLLFALVFKNKDKYGIFETLCNVFGVFLKGKAMLRIEETDVPVFPEDDFLENYEGCDVATLIFMLAIDASGGDRVRRLGDSGIYIMAEPTGNKNDEGLDELEKYIKESGEYQFLKRD